jgi:flagellar hook assembly protein FlgD
VLFPKEYELSSAHPNPFNPTLTIPFGLPLESDVTIEIYNVMGHLVRTLQSDNIKAGFHQVQWKGTSNSGRKVPSGMYIVRMNAVSTNGKKSFQKSQKIVLLK